MKFHEQKQFININFVNSISRNNDMRDEMSQSDQMKMKTQKLSNE